MSIKEHNSEYQSDGKPFDLFVARPDSTTEVPSVLICPAWDGLNEPIKDIARRLAGGLGYQAVGIDLYGQGIRGEPGGDNSALMNPLLEDRQLLTDRLLTATKAALAIEGSSKGPAAVIGYCFGGLCALDIARANAPGIAGVVSFHGLLFPNGLEQKDPITAKILVEHGWDDPMATPENLLDFAKEMDNRKADWQVHVHGGAMHAFTNPAANRPGDGLQYHEHAASRSWHSMLQHFEELFGSGR